MAYRARDAKPYGNHGDGKSVIVQDSNLGVLFGEDGSPMVGGFRQSLEWAGRHALRSYTSGILFVYYGQEHWQRRFLHGFSQPQFPWAALVGTR
jgi:hypothetical protein